MPDDISATLEEQWDDVPRRSLEAIAVEDSGPLHYLILLEHTELLRRFYGQVVVPEPATSELSGAGAPGVVREWITKPPTWVDVRPVPPDAVSMITDDLDLGERAAAVDDLLGAV